MALLCVLQTFRSPHPAAGLSESADDGGSAPYSGQEAFGPPEKHPSPSLCLSMATAGSCTCDLKNAADASLGVQRKLSFNLIQTLMEPEHPGPVRCLLLLPQ